MVNILQFTTSFKHAFNFIILETVLGWREMAKRTPVHVYCYLPSMSSSFLLPRPETLLMTCFYPPDISMNSQVYAEFAHKF